MKVSEALGIRTSLKNKLSFINYKRTYAKKYLPMLEIGQKYNYLPELDVLVIGSDEVFNCIQDNTNVGFSPELFGEGCKTDYLISFAASFGNTTLEKLELYGKKAEIKRYLSHFKSLSVRDENSILIVKSLLGKEPQKHLDPVLVFDYMHQCSRIPNDLRLDKPYIILYGYSGRITRDEAKKIEKFAQKSKKEILFLGGIQHCKGVFKDCSPFDVLGYFKNADCVITDTFHGTIFSIINHKPFFTIVRKSINNSYGNQEKLTDLLNTLKLSHRAVEKVDHLERIYEDIDYSNVEKIIMKERKKAYDYLQKNIVG